MPTLIYCLRWFGTSSELGPRLRRGVEAQDIGLSYGAFFDCSEVVTVANKSKKKKGKKKKRKEGKGNEEEDKNPSYGISAAAGRMIRSFHLISQCD